MTKKANSYQKMFKAALATAVVTGSLVTVAPLHSEAAKLSISDISKNQHKDAIISLVDRGIVNGFPDGTYKPNQEVTRGQAAKILAQILNLDTKNVTDPGFTDVKKDNQYYGAIAALVNAGIISGYEDKTFKPGNPLTRAHMAKILAIGFELQEEAAISNRFTDVSPTSWYASFVQALLTNKITSGTSATTYSPNAFVTRGQLASFVVRSESLAPKVDVEAPSTPDEELPKEEVEKPAPETDKPEENGDKIDNNKPGTPDQKEEDKGSKVSAAAIEQKYAAQLDALETRANSQLDALMDAANKELKEKQANGEKIDYGYFYDKYMGKAKSLEASTDASFYSILSAMEAELIANGYSTDSTKGLADNYESIKEGLKGGI